MLVPDNTGVTTSLLGLRFFPGHGNFSAKPENPRKTRPRWSPDLRGGVLDGWDGAGHKIVTVHFHIFGVLNHVSLQPLQKIS